MPVYQILAIMVVDALLHIEETLNAGAYLDTLVQLVKQVSD